MSVPVIEVHGAKIPAIGMGTMTLKEKVCVDAVSAALRMGYTSLDTAERYGNEEWVGEGLRASGVSRDKVFVTTKVYVDKLAPADFEKSVDASLQKLQLSSVDLLLIHWPSATVPLSDQIASLCKAKREGKTRHVGVANFTVRLLDEAMKLTTEPLVNNQIEVHPFLDQSKVLAACKKHGLTVTAYCPIARGKVPGAEVLERIGQAHGKSSSQVSLRWLTQQGIIPIPRSANPDHLKANLDVFDWRLSDAEMAEIGKLHRPDGRVVNPAHHPEWDS
jgi:2,5-diketo-D-gluconate reductase B